MGEDARSALIDCVWSARQPSTIEKYGYIIRKFLGYYALTNGSLILPLQSAFVANYLLLIPNSQSVAAATLCALKWLHGFIPGLNDYNDPLNDKFLSKIVNGISRSNSKSKIRKMPLSEDMIKNVLNRLKTSSTLTELRDALIPAFAYALLLRADELVHMNCSHISETEEGFKILIPSSKTDVYRGGKFVFISKDNKLLTKCFGLYLARARLKIGDNHFLFPALSFDLKSGSVGTVNRMLSYDKYRAILKLMVESLGLDNSDYGTHSCRSGGATFLASNVDQHSLMVNGRWRDPRSLGSYIEIDDKDRFEISKKFNL